MDGGGLLTATVRASISFEEGNDLLASIPPPLSRSMLHSLAMVNLVKAALTHKGVTAAQVALAL